MSPSKQSRRHKHLPAQRLSPDAASNLPDYIPSPGWNHYSRVSHSHFRARESGQVDEQQREEPDSWDKPPDYPDSAEEADEDTDDTNTDVLHVPQHHRLRSLTPPASFSPGARTGSPTRRSKRFLALTPTHKRRQSSQSHLLRPSRSSLHHKPRQASERLLSSHPASDSADPYLDSLLERSVHALEMSNTLLQSSISTQTSLSTILAGADAGGSLPETSLEAHTLNLRTRIQGDWDARAAWTEDLEEITRDVEGLFSGGSGTITTASVLPTPSTLTEAGSFSDDKEGMITKTHRKESSSASGMSCSLPTASTLSSASMTWNRRRPSLDLAPGLHFARQSRENLISPPPRPITQYAPSIQLSDEIVFPSTIGVRSQLSTPQWKSVSELASSSTTSLLAAPSLSTPLLPPKLTDKPSEPSTPAYNMLSSFVNRQPSSGPNTPSTSFTTSFMATIRRTGTQTRRSSSTSPSPRLRDCTPRSPHRDGICQRPMTPPVEESSSSESCMAKRTVQSLRKILDEQPPPVARTAALGLSGDKLRSPKFMPRTPAPLPEASTSNATASVSRLFTKNTHSSSTRAPSPPRQSAMKHSRNNSSTPSTPNSARHLPPQPLPLSSSSSKSLSLVPSVPEMVSKVLNGRIGSASSSSSGRSTPNKRISFAELPESYASTRPGGAGSSKFKEKQNRGKRKGGTAAAGDASADGGGGGGGGGGLGFGTARWWLGTTSLTRQEERIEERITRSWGGRMAAAGFFSSGLDEWAD